MPQALHRNIPVGTRIARVLPDSVNVDTREVDVVWTTGAQVRRYDWYDGDYLEELSLDPGACDLTRLNSGAPLLDSHESDELDSVLGNVVDGTAVISGGEGRARVRFVTGDPDVDSIWNKVVQRAIRSISVGYLINEIQEIRRDGQIPIMRATKWEPIELSFVACPADAGAGIRSKRSAPCTIHRAQEATMPEPVTTPAAETAVVTEPAAPDAAKIEADARAAATAHIRDITQRCALAGLSARAVDDILSASEGKTSDEIHALIMAKRDALISATRGTEISGYQSPDASPRKKRLVDHMTNKFAAKGGK